MSIPSRLLAASPSRVTRSGVASNRHREGMACVNVPPRPGSSAFGVGTEVARRRAIGTAHSRSSHVHRRRPHGGRPPGTDAGRARRAHIPDGPAAGTPGPGRVALPARLPRRARGRFHARLLPRAAHRDRRSAVRHDRDRGHRDHVAGRARGGVGGGRADVRAGDRRSDRSRAHRGLIGGGGAGARRPASDSAQRT